MNFNFEDAQLAFRSYGTGMPDNILRVAKDHMTLSLNIVETRVPKRYMSPTNKGGERFRAIIEFDKANKAIRLTPTDDTKGFSFSTGRSTYNAQSTFPVRMKRAGMDRGDYILVDADRLIFQLADVANQQQDVREY